MTPGPGDRVVRLTRGMEALISAEDWPLVGGYLWHAHDAGRGLIYASRRLCGGGRIYMHREIVRPPRGMLVDHANRCGLDNRRSNLRLATRAQNAVNCASRPGETGFRGVSRHGSGFRARITRDGKELYLGTFRTVLEAAAAYDAAAREEHGPFAWLNFPDVPAPDLDEEIPF